MKRIFVAPLDWGLGHTTRCIPVIREFVSLGHKVIIGGSGESFALLKKEFPSLESIILPAYNPRYPATGSMAWKMARQLPKFIQAIRDEHALLEKLVVENKIDLVISDNRYGLWSSCVPSVLITHQSNILMPLRFGWLENVVRYFNHRQMKKFSVCWIPDSTGKNSLAGDLTKFGATADIKFEFVGALSRFKRSKVELQNQILAILSGPEPQRTILEKLIVPQIRKSGLRYFIVLGQVTQQNSYNDPRIVDFMTTDLLQEKILSSELVICRSGYSSVMDLAALGKKAIFIPTPGQTEQEHLAATVKEKLIAFSMAQNIFELRTAMNESSNYTGFVDFPESQELLETAIKRILTYRNVPEYA
jgi:uncharacterized protein (TIGR00661 family)